MTSFSEVFERFSPWSWLECGMTTRDDRVKSERSKPIFAKANFGKKGISIALSASAIGLVTTMATPAVAQTAPQWVHEQPFRATTDFSDPADVVPIGHWVRLMEDIRGLEVLQESGSDPEPLF